MANLPAEAVERMDVAREAAEREFERDLKPLEKTENPLECIPAFAKFSVALFHSGTARLLASLDGPAALRAGVAVAAERFDARLEELIASIVEKIRSDAGLALSRPPGENYQSPVCVCCSRYRRIRRISTYVAEWVIGAPGHVYEIATGEEWEEDADGRQRPVTDPAYAKHNLWEYFGPPGVQFSLRSPSTNAKISRALESALRRAKPYGMERFYEWFREQESNAARMLSLEASATSPEQSGDRPEPEAAIGVPAKIHWPAAERNSSTSPDDLKSLYYIQQQLGSWNEVELLKLGGASRTTLRVWRNVREGKPHKPISNATDARIADAIQSKADELRRSASELKK
jgi:hypothetical protein